MNRTKTISTSFLLALACTGLGCSGALDPAEEGLTLNQVVDDDSRVDVDGGVSTVDAGRSSRADAGDADDAGDAGLDDDDDDGRGVQDDDDHDGKGRGCRFSEAWRRRFRRDREHGHAIDGGLGIPGFSGFGEPHEAPREHAPATGQHDGRVEHR